MFGGSNMLKSLKDNKGIASNVLIPVLVVVVVIAGLVIWQATKSSNKTSSSSSKTTASKVSFPESSSCVKEFSDQHLCAFALNEQINNKQYTAVGTVTNKSGSKASYTVDNDGKGNTEVSYNANGQAISSIQLDGITYVKEGTTATWLEYSAGSASVPTVASPTSGFNLNFVSSTPSDVKVLYEGQVSCGSFSCFKYKVNVTSTPTATNYVYFDNSKYLLRQWTSTDSSTGINIDLSFNYNPVSITKPSPVQQATL